MSAFFGSDSYKGQFAGGYGGLLGGKVDTPPEPTLYVNPEFAGEPGVAHTILFDTGDDELVSGNHGFYTWRFITAAGQRSVASYNIRANNPTLTVGNLYRIEYRCTKHIPGTYAAGLFAQDFVGLALGNEDRVANSLIPNKLLFIEFVVTDPNWTGVIRFGSGTTANRADELSYRTPRLIDLGPGPLTADGQILTYNGEYLYGS